MFLAFKVKVRFRLRFERKYGKSQDERLRKHAVRNMTANAAFMHDAIVRRCFRCVAKFVNRANAIALFTPKTLAFYDSVVKAQAAVKRLLPFKMLRYANLKNAFKREGQGLVRYFD